MSRRAKGRLRRTLALVIGLVVGGLAGFGVGALLLSRGLAQAEKPDPNQSDPEVIGTALVEAIASVLVVGASIGAGIVLISPFVIRGVNHLVSGFALLVCVPSDRRYARRLRQSLALRGVTVRIAEQPGSPNRPTSVGAKDQESMERCAALIVLASPSADRSASIRNVITSVAADSKPIFPIVVHGDEIPRIATEYQYFDARNARWSVLPHRRLPTRAFVKSIIRWTG